MLIADSVEKVGMGTQLVDRAGATMQEIVDSIRRVTDIMGEITTASREQTAGIEQVNQAIMHMDQTTQQNAALVEEAAAAAASMQDQASSLVKVVSLFKIDNAAQMGRAPPSRMAAPASAKVLPIAVKAKKPEVPALKAPTTRQLTQATSGGDWEEF